ncbi:MAG TPA: TRAM domain-containing protein, partial [Usitatibacter sp.]
MSIDSLAFGGEGVARLGDGGYVVFVAGAIPGDRVRAVVHKRKRNYAHARAVEVLEPSPERIPPRADHPGVPWQVLPYERQLEIKRGQVDDALRRIGRLDGFELEEIVPAVEPWRYRNKLEYSFGADSDPARPGLVCGFHAPAGGNAVVAIEDCLLASERGNLARQAALGWCRAQGLTAWDRGGGRRGRTGEDSERAERTGPGPDGRARLRNLVVREGRRSGQLQIRVVTTDGELEAGALAGALSDALGESLCGVLWTRSRSLAETTAGGDTELVWGEAELPERLGELDLRISPEAFFQTNTEMAELLYEVVVEYAALEGWERVFDLYSGIGTIALTLA